jgi:hypothetical protein
MRRLVAPASEAKPEPKALVLAAISGGWSMENVRSYGHERFALSFLISLWSICESNDCTSTSDIRQTIGQ